MPRVFLCVLDSFGIGGAPDAAAYGDAGADTYGHIRARAAPDLPHMEAMGLKMAHAFANNISGIEAPPGALCAAAAETSNGKDTPSGHWEIAGTPVRFDWGYFPQTTPTFPEYLINALISQGNLPGILGNEHASGTEILERLGAEHVATGQPICYTSVDSVFQIAAHEHAFGLDKLYQLCEITRKLVDPLNIGRVIARPFVGAEGAFERTPNRRDYASPPPDDTILDRAAAVGRSVISIGKIDDIFAHRGVTDRRKGVDDMALFDALCGAAGDAPDGALIFANFVEFDSKYGHRRDVAGYARALERFDARLPEITGKLRPDDMLILTADHGNDPTWPGTDHTREQVPVLALTPGGQARLDGSLRRETFADIGETAAAWLGLPQGPHGAPIWRRTL